MKSPRKRGDARHILIQMKTPETQPEEPLPGEGAKPEVLTKPQARAKAEEVLKRVKAGEDFVGLAKQYSTDPGSKENGGDLGWFGRGRMVPEFEKAAFALATWTNQRHRGSPFGFHIIKVDERRTGHNKRMRPVAREKEKKVIEKSFSVRATTYRR